MQSESFCPSFIMNKISSSWTRTMNSSSREGEAVARDWGHPVAASSEHWVSVVSSLRKGLSSSLRDRATYASEP